MLERTTMPARTPPRLFRRLRGKQPPPTGGQAADIQGLGTNAGGHPSVELSGPFTSPTKGHVVIELKNITSLKTHAAALGNRRADLSLILEHSLPPQALSAMKTTFLDDFKKLLLGSVLDPNCSHPTGGVGAICPRDDTLFIIEPIADSFAKQAKLGRAALFAYGKGKGSKLAFFYCIYGHSGGHGNSSKAHLTNTIVQAVDDDIKLRPPGAHFIVGDFNADVPDIPALERLTVDEGWVDLGAVADQWGQPPNQSTCITKGAHDATRRDYVFSSPMAFQLVSHFQVDAGDVCPTHSTLTFHLNTGDAGFQQYQAKKPAPLEHLLEQAFKQQYGFALQVQSDVAFFDHDWAEQNPTLATPTSTTKALIKADKDMAEQGVKMLHARYIHNFHQCLDHMLNASDGILRSLLLQGNTTEFWFLLWEIIEQCTIEFTEQAQDRGAIKYTGRGRHPVSLKHQTPLFSRELDGNFSGKEPKWVHCIAVQANRCKHLATCMAIHLRAKAKPARLEILAGEIQAVKAATLKAIDEELACPGLYNQGLPDEPGLRSRAADLKDLLASEGISSNKQIFLLEHAAARYTQVHLRQLKRLQQEIIGSRKAKMHRMQDSIGSMCPSSPPVQHPLFA